MDWCGRACQVYTVYVYMRVCVLLSVGPHNITWSSLMYFCRVLRVNPHSMSFVHFPQAKLVVVNPL